MNASHYKYQTKGVEFTGKRPNIYCLPGHRKEFARPHGILFCDIQYPKYRRREQGRKHSGGIGRSVIKYFLYHFANNTCLIIRTMSHMSQTTLFKIY